MKWMRVWGIDGGPDESQLCARVPTPLLPSLPHLFLPRVPLEMNKAGQIQGFPDLQNDFRISLSNILDPV